MRLRRTSASISEKVARRTRASRCVRVRWTAPMQGHDGLTGSGRAGDPGRTVVVAFHHASLGRMQKYNPALPRVIERERRSSSTLVITRKRRCASGCANGSSCPVMVCLPIQRNGLGTPLDLHGLQRGRLAQHVRRRLNRRATRRKFQQCLGRLRGKVVGEGRATNPRSPPSHRPATRPEHRSQGNSSSGTSMKILRASSVAAAVGDSTAMYRGNLDFAHHLANLDNLCRPGSRMLLRDAFSRPSGTPHRDEST